jgi:hypothetical protein
MPVAIGVKRRGNSIEHSNTYTYLHRHIHSTHKFHFNYVYVICMQLLLLRPTYITLRQYSISEEYYGSEGLLYYLLSPLVEKRASIHPN